MSKAARIGHELTEIRAESPRFAIFSLTIVIKNVVPELWAFYNLTTTCRTDAQQSIVHQTVWYACQWLDYVNMHT